MGKFYLVYSDIAMNYQPHVAFAVILVTRPKNSTPKLSVGAIARFGHERGHMKVRPGFRFVAGTRMRGAKWANVLVAGIRARKLADCHREQKHLVKVAGTWLLARRMTYERYVARKTRKNARIAKEKRVKALARVRIGRTGWPPRKQYREDHAQ